MAHLLNPQQVLPSVEPPATDSAMIQIIAEQFDVIGPIEPTVPEHEETPAKAQTDTVMVPVQVEQPEVVVEVQIDTVMVPVEERPEVVVRSNKRHVDVSQDVVTPRKKPKTVDAAIIITDSAREKTPPLIPSSTLWSRIQNKMFSMGELPENAVRDAKFAAKIKSLDRNSTIINAKTVCHVKCGKELKMKEPYHTTYFKTHVELCKGRPKSHKQSSAGMNLISSFFQSSSGPHNTAVGIKTKSMPAPCPGLSREVYSQVDLYLERTGARGGGASSVSVLAQDLFGKRYGKLSVTRKKQVKMVQTHDWLWRNDHTTGAVFSTTCGKNAQRKSSNLEPCSDCESLLSKKAFKNITRAPQPIDSNYKFLNQEYRNEQLSIVYGKCKGLRGIMEVSDDHI